jgi:hypothetical protein
MGYFPDLDQTKQASRLQIWKLLSGEATGNGGVAVLVTMMCNVSPTNQRMEWKASDRTGLLLCVSVCGAKATVSIYLHQYFFSTASYSMHYLLNYDYFFC